MTRVQQRAQRAFRRVFGPGEGETLEIDEFTSAAAPAELINLSPFALESLNHDDA